MRIRRQTSIELAISFLLLLWGVVMTASNFENITWEHEYRQKCVSRMCLPRLGLSAAWYPTGR